MDLNKFKKTMKDLDELNENVHKLIKKARALEKLSENEETFIQLISAQNVTIMSLSDLMIEVSNTAVMANDIVDNLSMTTGSGIDVFINEFSTRSSSVMDKKLLNIKDSLNDFSKMMNENLSEIEKAHVQDTNEIKKWVSIKISPLVNYFKSIKINALLTTFIISIFGGLVAIKLYQMFYSYLG